LKNLKKESKKLAFIFIISSMFILCIPFLLKIEYVKNLFGVYLNSLGTYKTHYISFLATFFSTSLIVGTTFYINYIQKQEWLKKEAITKKK
jgi:hypothetical protein